MENIPDKEVQLRISAENPWWGEEPVIHPHFLLKRRAYFELFFPLVNGTQFNRAAILMGPRRVGKTVLLRHVIQALLEEGVRARNICYLEIDDPLYNGRHLRELLQLYSKVSGADLDKERSFIFFDEIQYRKDWEIHLKHLVDDFPGIKFIASGSAAAALRRKSEESGAGRFTDFILPPLTFHEYLELIGQGGIISIKQNEPYAKSEDVSTDIETLNTRFLDYVNFGGYPEVSLSPTIQSDPARFIKSDIIDRVLLRDLPSLYGIHDVQELNSLFTTLAYNTAKEIRLEDLSRSSGVGKNTIKRYLDYLEAAFLIQRVNRIDRSAKRFQRENFFKIYLTNPSMRCALFSPIYGEDDGIGELVETSVFAQWFHGNVRLYYARWENKGEVDIVALNKNQKPWWAVEVKWSDRYVSRPEELKGVVGFCKRHNLQEVTVTSRTQNEIVRYADINVKFVPASIYCWTVGYNLVKGTATRPNLTA